MKPHSKKTSKTTQTIVFRPSAITYAAIIFIPSFITFAFWLVSYNSYDITTNEEYIFMGLVVVTSLLYLVWSLNSFYIQQESLFIKKSIFSIKHTIALNDVKTMAIERVSASRQNYKTLIIRCHSSPKKVFKFPLSREDKQAFIEAMDAKNIIVKDYS